MKDIKYAIQHTDKPDEYLLIKYRAVYEKDRIVHVYKSDEKSNAELTCKILNDEVDSIINK